MLTSLEKLVLDYPNKDWDWYLLTINPNITLNFMKKNMRNNQKI